MAYASLIHELEDEMGLPLPRASLPEANDIIDATFHQSTDDATLATLTLKIVRALVPLFQTQLLIGSQQERRVVLSLEPFVEQLLTA